MSASVPPLFFNSTVGSPPHNHSHNPSNTFLPHRLIPSSDAALVDIALDLALTGDGVELTTPSAEMVCI